MSTQTGDIFGNTGSPSESTQTPNTPSASDDLVNKLKNIKNERGEQKYDSVAKALEALQASQEFIPTLKSQLAEKDEEIRRLKEIADKAQSVDELVSRLTASNTQPTTPAQTFDEQKAAALFDQLLNKTRAETARAENVRAVTSNLVARFGSTEGAIAALQEKAKSLGTTTDSLRMLAAENPKLVLELFPEPQRTPTAPSSVNSAGFFGKETPTGLEKPTKSLLAGATYKDQLEYLKKIREQVYKQHGID